MQLSEYQREANKTDQLPLGGTGEERLKGLMVPLLGLCGETGSLLMHFKRYLRDGEKYGFFRERISEELGDILWNVANVATKANLDLDEIATANLMKIQDRWVDESSEAGAEKLLDSGYPPSEQFPRQFEIKVASDIGSLGRPKAWLEYQGRPFGDGLTDNAEEDDGYRHHDVFHLAFVAILGWSPVLRGRSFFNCKRRSNKDVDEIEDGGRAAVIDEAIAALIFVEAKKSSFYDGVDSVEYGILRTIKDLTAHLEVRLCTGRQWESAILQGFRVWRELRSRRGGWIVGDLAQRSLEFRPDSEECDL